METEKLVLWATNHAPMYQKHLRLAREHASYASWAWHVTGTLIPEYRRDFHEPYEGMSTYETLMAASKLMEYYADHIAEGASPSAITVKNRTVEQVLASLRENVEHTITDADGTQWGSVYLDNARGSESEKSFRACLAALWRQGLYQPQDGFAFGDVKLKDEA